MPLCRWQYCIPFQNASAKTGDGQIRRLQKAPQINWLLLQHPLSNFKKNDRLIILTHMSIKAKYLVKINWTCSEMISPTRPFCNFFTDVQNEKKFPQSNCIKPHHICTRCSHIQCASKLCINIPIFQSVSEWQRYNEMFSVKNADFATLIGCHGNVLWAIA